MHIFVKFLFYRSIMVVAVDGSGGVALFGIIFDVRYYMAIGRPPDQWRMDMFCYYIEVNNG